MTIPAAPTVPVPTSSTFAADAYAFTQWQATLGPAIDAETQRLNELGFGSYNTTSTTSLTIGTGSKSLTVEAGKGYAVGQAVMIASTAGPTNYMVGQVTSYNSGTGALVVNVTGMAGSGTVAAWTVSLTSILSASVAYVNRYENRLYTETTTTFTVPAGVTSLRGYAVGKGGNGSGNSGSGTAGGGGGGMAFGSFPVEPGGVVTLSIVSGIAKVSFSGVDLLIANPSTNAVNATGGTGGTSSKHASVTSGGAFTGGSGAASSGGASAASPLGNGVNAGGSDGGAGIGGAGGFQAGGGGAGGTIPSYVTYGGGSGPTLGSSRPFSQRFVDPLLRHADGAGGAYGLISAVPQAASFPSPGGGGYGGSGTGGVPAQSGGDFGGGGFSSAVMAAGNGGFLGGGGCHSGASYSGGAGGAGGGGGASGAAGGGGLGGPAAIILYY